MTKIVTSLLRLIHRSKNGVFKLAVALLIMSCIIGSSEITRAQHLKEKFKVVNRMISLDKKSGTIHLNEAEGAGIAWINHKEFIEGTIEFDVKGKDKIQGSFVGIAFHGLNDSTYESIYFRPFNFRASDPDRKSHAVQYIANPGYDWPKLRAEFPNKYEQPISPAPDPNQWFHVKITVSGELICVYVNSGKQPVLKVKSLTHTHGKMIGYWLGNGSGGDWKNLKIINSGL